MKETINEAMKQDFSSHAVLGRVLFGVSFLILGLYSVLNSQMFASNAPSFVPDMLGPLLVVGTGAIFIGAGFGIATGKAVARGSVAIAAVWAAMAIFSNALSSYFDVREFFIALAFIGAALTIKAQAESGTQTKHEPSPHDAKATYDHDHDAHHKEKVQSSHNH